MGLYMEYYGSIQGSLLGLGISHSSLISLSAEGLHAPGVDGLGS